MSGSVSSRRSNKSYRGYKGDDKKTDGYTGDDELRAFTFTIGVGNAQSRFLKARNGIAEMVGRKMGDDIYQLIRYGKEATFSEPAEPAGEQLTYGQQKKYELEYRAYMEDVKQYKKNKGKLFRTIAGQCVPALRARIENMVEYKTMEGNHDVAGLMELIEGLVYNNGKGEYPYWTMATNLRKVADMRQGEKESLGAFTVRFLAQVENAEKVSGAWIPNNLKGRRMEEQEDGRNRLLACIFLGGCDRGRYKAAVDELYHDYGKGDNKYPADITGVAEFLNGRRGGNKNKDKEDDLQDGLVTSFVQRDTSKVMCYNCQELGHYSWECTKPKRSKGKNDISHDDRLIRIDANAHASAFQFVEDDISSQGSRDDVQERADEWNSYNFW